MKKLLICLVAMSLALLCACTTSDPDKTSSDPDNFTTSESVAQTETEAEKFTLYPEKTPQESNPVSDPDETQSANLDDDGTTGEKSSEVTTTPKEPSVQSSKDPTVPTESEEKRESSSQQPAQPTEKRPEPEETTKPVEAPAGEPSNSGDSDPIETQPVTEPEPEPEQTTEPEQTEPEVPTFHIQTWIDYAISYGQQIGLEYDSSATDCWDNPIIASSQSKYLERDITSRLNRYLDRGMTGFCVWAEARADGKYDLYIGYR